MLRLDLNLVRSEGVKTVCVYTDSLNDVHTLIQQEIGLPADSYFLKSNGRVVESDPGLGSQIQVVPRLLGGKGGFGSMLRAIGAQIEKTTNREACRDLSGRRLRDINEEQRLKKWISQQKEREKQEEERRLKKLEKLEKLKKEAPKHDFKDEEYEAMRSELTEKISDSVEAGFKAGPSKRKADEPVDPDKKKKKKKKKKTILDDFSSSSSDSEEEVEEPKT